MSCNETEMRDNIQKDQNNLNYLQNPLVQSIIRIFVTSSTVATALYPLEVIITRLQTGTKGSLSLNPMLYSHQVLRPLISGYLTTQKASLVKNSVLSNKDKVSEHIENLAGEKKPEPGFLKKHQDMLLTSFIIANIDTLLTQYFANKRILNVLGEQLSLSFLEKLKFAKEGLMLRGGKNFMTTLGCISATTLFSDLFNPLISKEKHLFIHTAASSLVAGFMVTPVSNALDVIYKNKIKQMNLVTMKSPDFKKILTELVKSEGKKALLRGSLFNCISNSLGFIVVNGVAEMMNQSLFNQSSTSTIGNQRNTFFASSPKAESKPVNNTKTPPLDEPTILASGAGLMRIEGITHSISKQVAGQHQGKHKEKCRHHWPPDQWLSGQLQPGAINHIPPTDGHGRHTDPHIG